MEPMVSALPRDACVMFGVCLLQFDEECPSLLDESNTEKIQNWFKI
jgi:hypothetical protein